MMTGDHHFFPVVELLFEGVTPLERREIGRESLIDAVQQNSTNLAESRDERNSYRRAPSKSAPPIY
jgi:hypothetical protein